MRRFNILLILILTSCMFSLFEAKEHINCVFGRKNGMKCIENTSEHQISTNSKSVPCKRHDIMCWNKYTLMYTNRIRRKYRKPLLRMGTYNQLKNAMNRAKILATKPKLVHQNLNKAGKIVKCKRWMSGENLARNGEKYNIARKCVNQWMASKEHFDALVMSWFREMVIGIHITKSGTVYCVQTFAVYSEKYAVGSKHGKGCYIPNIWEKTNIDYLDSEDDD